jgi:hypothetical protein
MSMKRLRSLYPAPAWALPRLSKDLAEKTWTCPACGVVPPIAFADGWYARRPCPCEHAAWEARQIEQLRAEMAGARQALTYTWLGRAWSEPELAGKTSQASDATGSPMHVRWRRRLRPGHGAC